ncbi:MAG: MBL fold metallo-hydrolase [Kutzneria sp.]|nr:MBL fold metallo-hydrolase [Kutzneria sp.]MBV9845619.1 MBL fold metallo-hydrolase [Kutzneria sp.]
MKLTVLGCSGSVPGPGAPASGYLVEADGFRLVVDFGNGTLAALQTLCDPFDIDAVLFSHLHPDHCADFAALAVFRWYHPAPPYDPRRRRLAVHGPSDTADRLAAAYAPNESERASTDLSEVFEFHSFGEPAVRIGPLVVTAARVAHPCEAYGIRLEHDGRTMAYTGDTGPCAAVTDLAAGTDLLLAEATWTDSADRPADMHLSGRQAGAAATDAGARQLVLTHVAPWTDRAAVLAEARMAFSGPVWLAEPGAGYEI